LDDQPIKGMTLNEAVKVMRGKVGTGITLTIVREGADKPLKIRVVRANIKVASVKSRLLEKEFGYIRIAQFQSHTTEDMLKAISRLKKESGGKVKGLVMDLRNNPGGVLNSAVSVSDAFLTDGLIVYTQGRQEDSQLKFKAASDDVLDGAPIVVLVNEGSASASEIVAGALQDHKRAVIMGKQTFGKGSVQTIVPIKGNTAVKITTARYYTPSGRSIQAEGIKPDIMLENVTVAASKASALNPIKEADLVGHLDNGNSAKTPGKKSEQGTDKQKPLVERDYQLNEALNLLKGLYILQARNRE
jgi:carboxyl-terminal processing protease